jgi:hypothetical protein
MASDRSLQALREASPRSRPGFDEWIERFDALQDQIMAAPVVVRGPGAARRRRLIGLSAVAVAISIAAAVAGLVLSAAAPQSAYAAARQAVVATAAAASGTMTMTVAHNGTVYMLDTTRWNGGDIAISSGPRHLLGPDRQVLLAGGGAYVQRADGTWLRYPSVPDLGPKVGPAVQLAEDNVAGSTAGQILALATGLRQAKQPDGTTLYTGTIPSRSQPRVGPASDTIRRMIASLRSGNEAGAPGGFHGDLKLRLTVTGDGRVQQVSVTFRQQDTGSPAGDGAYTWSVTYSQLGATPPITVPQAPTAPTPGGGPAPVPTTTPATTAAGVQNHHCPARGIAVRAGDEFRAPPSSDDATSQLERQA